MLSTAGPGLATVGPMSGELRPVDARVRALESILVEKGYEVARIDG
ncbi:hypothetical protein Ae406Ps2_2914 [Pseudonocardia sp. Ae406_Ps2]|nr:hypothetical protein Ae331Ps2_3012c [Pseudonocardia sp. Ae331_Ps2]OLM02914.1 hypothetical protein Ae406Ps2_2914 [Pseudonocardia sp. Ae406_Ps2]OLM24492.1 hypothetical protein Ae706Ps2_2925 [Pseudonocardia sp. Ae706_Ps2]